MQETEKFIRDSGVLPHVEALRSKAIPREYELRRALVDEAVTWLKTPWHHHAGIKGVGVDCFFFVARVYQAVGLTPTEAKMPDYPHDWHMHRDEQRYVIGLKAGGFRKVDEPLPGDIALFKFGRVDSHAGICVNDNDMIHSYVRFGVYADAIRAYRSRLTGFYSYFPPNTEATPEERQHLLGYWRDVVVKRIAQCTG